MVKIQIPYELVKRLTWSGVNCITVSGQNYNINEKKGLTKIVISECLGSGNTSVSNSQCYRACAIYKSKFLCLMPHLRKKIIVIH